MNIDITLKFVSENNHVSNTTDYETRHIIIEDGIQVDTLVQLMMNHLFPEYRVFEGWDEDVIAHGRVILLEEGKRSKDGFCLLYQDSSIAIVTECEGEVVLRYIGDAAMMHNRLDDIQCINPKADNWFTSLPAR